MSRSRLPKGFSHFRPDLGRILRDRRRDAGFRSSKAFAAAVGISRESLSRIENGRSWPRPDTIDAILRTLEIDWDAVAISGRSPNPERFFDGTWQGDLKLRRGAALRRGRRMEGISLRDLAKRCGVSAAQLSRIERGEGLRSAVYTEHPDDVGMPRGYRRISFAHPELRRLELLGSE